MAGDGNFVVVSNREIYDAVRELEKTVTRMDDSMKSILTENTDTKKRLRKLEVKVYGVLAGTGGLFLTAVSIVARGKGLS